MVGRATNLTPPAGSTISVTNQGSEPVITIPPGGGVGRVLVTLFIALWLCLWTAGFVAVGRQVLNGTASAFSTVWLGGWTIGGCFAVALLYRLLRRSIPETLQLGFAGVGYDSGIPPYRYNYYPGRYIYGRWSPLAPDARSSLLPKRTIVTIDRRQMQSLRLRETDGGNRLTVDAGATRLDLAQAASEVEREWLYRVLAEKYAVQAAPTGAVGAMR